jgi:hypothetical protein
MLKKNLDSRGGSKEGKRPRRFWTEPLRALISSLTFLALCPVALVAQATSPAALMPTQAAVYGAGFQTPLRFEGEPGPENQLSFALGASALYDSNVLSTNSLRIGDEALSFDSHIAITRQTGRLTANFDYMPYFLLYRRFDQYDRTNHAANLNLAYLLTSRLFLGLHDTFSYQNGAYPSLVGQQIMSGPTSPTALNQVIIPYTIRELRNMAGLDLAFVKNRRTTLTLSGGYNRLDFMGKTAGQSLYDGNGVSGGLTFKYGVTEHTNFGFLLLHQDTTYQGGEVFGNRLRCQIESMFLSVGSRLSPTVAVTIFGGPQYVRTIGQVSAAANVTGHFHASGGASITKEVRKTALDLSFHRSVSDGAGLYASVIDTGATFGARRRLLGNWEADAQATADQADTSLFQLGNEKTDALIGGIKVSRPFSHGPVFHISYNTMHELNKGTVPIFAGFDRNQIAVGIDYQFKALPLGR